MVQSNIRETNLIRDELKNYKLYLTYSFTDYIRSDQTKLYGDSKGAAILLS